MADKQPEEGKPWDAALGAVSKQLEDATKGVREATADGVGQVRGAVMGNVAQAKELSSSARIAVVRTAQKAWEAVQKTIRPAVSVFEQADSAEGTPLRKQFATARESVNRQLYDAQVIIQDTKKVADEQLVPVKSALDFSKIQLIKANEFRREHPEAAAAGLALIVGLPSLVFRGKWAAARNAVVAVGAGAAAAYGSDKFAERKSK